MLGLAGLPLDMDFLFVDPTPASPARVAGKQLVADYAAAEATRALSDCDVVTYEFENVPEQAARELATRVPVHPNPAALLTSQDRVVEKATFRKLGIATPASLPASTLEELSHAVRQLGVPCVAKTRRFGYDGKGQVVIRAEREVEQAWAELGGAPSNVEAFVPFERELSLIAVRGRGGEVRCYPLVENRHREGILRLTRAPAVVTPEQQRRAETYVTKLLEELDYVGVLTLELFQAQGELLANEFAPRVHNSGHFTIEGAETSQFENHLRAVAGLPLGSTRVPRPSAMVNLVGTLPSPEDVLRIPGAHLHLYGKEPRPRRKVGHVTLVAEDRETLEPRISQVLALAGEPAES